MAIPAELNVVLVAQLTGEFRLPNGDINAVRYNVSAADICSEVTVAIDVTDEDRVTEKEIARKLKQELVSMAYESDFSFGGW